MPSIQRANLELVDNLRPFFVGWDYLAVSEVYAAKVLRYAPFAYWRMNEGSGTSLSDISGNGYNTTATGITWDANEGPDSNSAPYFDGVNDYIDMSDGGGNSILADFPRTDGSVLVWVRVGPGALVDGTIRVVVRMNGAGSGSGNPRVSVQKSSVNNRVRFFWEFQLGTTIGVGDYSNQSNYGWFPVGLTWSSTSQFARHYIGSMNPPGHFGTYITGWSAPFQATMASFIAGATDSTPNSPFDGWIRDMVLFDFEATPGQMRDLMTWGV